MIAYQPRYRVTGQPTWINFGPQITVAPFTVTVTGLAGSTGYDFDVQAINSFGSTASATVTATTKTSVTESPEGTTITAANETTQFIYDASLLQWSLTAGGQVATSPSPYTTKTPVAGTSGLVEVLFHNATVFVENSANSWYYWNGSSFIPTLDIIGPIFVGGSTSPTFSTGASGVNVGALTVTTVGAVAFSGAYSITGADAAFFTITSGNLVTAATTTARTYNINLTATQSNVVGSPFTQSFSISATSVPSRRAGTRFPYATATQPAWPYAYNTVFNIGIGSNVLYSGPSGSDPLTANLLSAPSGTFILSNPGEWEYPYYVGQSTDQVLTSLAETGGTAWAPTPSFTLHVSAAATPSNDSDTILTLSDVTQPTLYAQWSNQCVIDRTAGTIQASGNGDISVWDTSGSGLAKTGQGNSHIGLQGLELDQGGIYRTLPCHLWGYQQKGFQPVSQWGGVNVYGQSINNGAPYNCVWPGIASDYDGGTGAGAGGYTGLVPFGSTIFLPPPVLQAAFGSDANSWSVGGTNPMGLTAGGIMIAKQLQNYGINDENTGGSFQIYTSWDVTSTPARTTTYNQINAALPVLFPYLRVMLNWMCYVNPGQTVPTLPAGVQYDPFYNASAPINGGGTYPLAPPYWDASLPSTFTSQNTY